MCGAQVGERKKTFVYGGIIGILWDPWLKRPGRRITDESGLIDATKVQVFAQLRWPSQDQMT
jgi:hypothetical protein